LGNGKYVTEDSGHTNLLFAEGTAINAPQQFQIVDAGGGNIALRCLDNNDYVSADNFGNSPLIANRTGVGLWETFTEFDAGNGNLALRATVNGEYVTVSNTAATLIAQNSSITTAASFTPQFITGGVPGAPGALVVSPGNGQV